MTVETDLQASAAEMLYGTTLRVPGEFFISEDTPAPDPQIFVEMFQQHMLQVRSVPAAHYEKRKVFAHKVLYSCTHVFVRVDAVRKPLEQPYEGPYKVISRARDNVFIVNVNGTHVSITTERLKPAFVEVTEMDETMEGTTNIAAEHQPFAQLKTYPGPAKKLGRPSSSGGDDVSVRQTSSLSAEPSVASALSDFHVPESPILDITYKTLDERTH
ncbi:uncharacterized protein LOC113463941, partial [Ceratina calcarata]|uniref:Uncharacterized protein LOC113463941 n=1 Tax=Ceratina calcarata TaxID=156304 RepID=A0AAJ7RWL4_9HYME